MRSNFLFAGKWDTGFLISISSGVFEFFRLNATDQILSSDGELKDQSKQTNKQNRAKLFLTHLSNH